jgi:hypothetical protein
MVGAGTVGTFAIWQRNKEAGWVRKRRREYEKLCKTKRQKDTMWRLTKERWEKDGESATYARTYIDYNNYAHWYYTASGQHGSVACNNPMERHNLAVKGSRNFDGFVEIGRDMYFCLTKEFVWLVHESSERLTSPTSELPVLDYKKASSNSKFMIFQSILDPSVDIREYGGGWLINDIVYMTVVITDDDVRQMELALEGVVEGNHSRRRRTGRHSRRTIEVDNQISSSKACSLAQFHGNHWLFWMWLSGTIFSPLVHAASRSTTGTWSEAFKQKQVWFEIQMSMHVSKALQVASMKLRRKKYEEAQKYTKTLEGNNWSNSEKNFFYFSKFFQSPQAVSATVVIVAVATTLYCRIAPMS